MKLRTLATAVALQFDFRLGIDITQVPVSVLEPLPPWICTFAYLHNTDLLQHDATLKDFRLRILW